jgi:predicted DNA binding protein
LQLWCNSPAKIDFLLSHHITSILLDALRVSLVADCSDIPATYTSSVAVLLLRNIIREPATHSLALTTFLDHQGVGLLLRALKFAKTDRALSLALYLLNDISRHSPTRVIQTVLETTENNTSASASYDSNGLLAIIDILNKRDTISQPTKFAALLVNRWALYDASTRAALIQVGVIPALLNVLRIWFQTNYGSSGTTNNSDSINDIVIYALSALSIVSQENPSRVTTALLSSSSREGGNREEVVVVVLLKALAAAMQCYEHRFSSPPSLTTVRRIGGGSYPHAMLSGMFDMTTTTSSSTSTSRQGTIQLIKQLIHCGLLPDWLAMQHVGGRILETTLQPEIRSAVFNNSHGIDRIGLQQKGEEEGEKVSLLSSSSSSQGQVAIALSHLAQRSPTFLADLCASDRLTILARGALQEAVQVALNVMEEEEEEEEEDGDEREEVSPLSLHDNNNHTCTSTALDKNNNRNTEWKVPLATTAAAAAIITTPTVPSQDLPGLLPTINSTDNISSSIGERDCSVSLSGQKRKAITMMKRSPSFTTQNGTNTAVIAAAAGNNNNNDDDDDDNSNTDAMRNEPCQYTAALSRIWSYLQHSTDAIKEDGKEEEHINASSSSCIHPSNKRRRRLTFNREDVGKKRYDTLTLTVGGGEGGGGGGCEIHAVGFLLEAWSPVFRQLLRNTVDSLTEKITIPCIAGFSEETMHALVLLALEFCYTGTIQTLSTTDAVKLWTVAEYLQTDCLQRYCESVLITGFEGSPVLVRQCYELAAPSPPSGMYLRAAVGEYLIKKICMSGGIYNNDNGGEVVALVLSHIDSLVEDVSGVLKREIQGGWVCPHIKERSKE